MKRHLIRIVGSGKRILCGITFLLAVISGMIGRPITSEAVIAPASYIIYKDGTTYYAQNGQTGVNDYSGTDASTVIQSAINALGTNGGKIFIKAGTYTLSTSIIFQKNQTIVGEGVDVTILKMGTVVTNKPIFKSYAWENSLSDYWMDNVEIGNMALDANSQPIDTSWFHNIRYSHIHDLKCINTYACGAVIGTFGSNLDQNVLYRNLIENIKVVGNITTNSDLMIVAGQIDSIIRNIELSGGGGSGLTMAANLRTKFIDIVIHDQSGLALSLEPAGNDRISDVEFIRPLIYNSTQDGFGSTHTLSYYSNDITIVDPIIYNVNRGIVAQLINGLRIDGGLIHDNKSGSIFINSCKDVKVNNVKIANTGVGNTVGFPYGLAIGVLSGSPPLTLSNIDIESPFIYQNKGASNTNLDGITIFNVPSGSNKIHNAVIYGMTNKNVKFEGTSFPAGFKWHRNIGFVTENSGTATIPNGSISVTVNHGLTITPGLDDISVTPTNSLGNATKFWISNPTATQFTINVNTNPGATTAGFAWNIEY